MARRLRQQGLHALRNNPNIARFVIEGEANGRQLGTGSYGSVEEVVTNGLVCAGKKIHEVLLDPGNEGVRDIAGRYVQECQLMSDLRHPNITQFMGVCFLPNFQLPVLLMEKLDGSLDDLLETIPNIPLVLKRSMLEDVSRGLLYLHKHTPQIIHRDLTAKNVLLTSFLVAKITDFGNARIVNLQPGQLARTLSRLPGTLAYMPPEALSANARYGPSLDVFSFGHLALFTLNQVFPGDLIEHNYPDPDNPDRLTGRTEVERRGQYFETLEQTVLSGRQHQPLVQLVKNCLHNIPSRRPSTEQVLQSLEEMKVTAEGPYGKFAKMDAVKQIAIMKDLKGRDEDVRVKTDELAAKDGEIQQLQQQLEQAQVQIQHKNTEIDQISTELQRRGEALLQKDMELQQKDIELQRNDEELQVHIRRIQDLNLAHQSENYEKDACIDMQQRQLETLQTELKAAQIQLDQLLAERRKSDSPNATNHTVQFVELEISSMLQWQEGRDMSVGMNFYPQAVVLRGRVYVGGGNSDRHSPNTIVAVYDPEHDTWSYLPQHNYAFFAMAVVNEKLMLLGGRDRVNKTTNIIVVWEEEMKRWRYYSQTSLPVARDAATAVVVLAGDNWLIVIGGRDSARNSLSTVDILNLSSHQWYSGTPLPQPAHKLSAAVTNVGKTLILLGGGSGSNWSSQVYSTQLDQLILSATALDFHGQSTPWQILPDTPVVSCTALAFGGGLLAVGGNKPGDVSSATDIHLFKPSTRSWVLIGHLPINRWRCACTVLSTGETFLAGGAVQHNVGVEHRVHIAALQ